MAHDAENVKLGHEITDIWSCISYKKVKPGDRAFFVKVAKEPKGIFGSGFITSDPFLEERYPGSGKQVYRVQVVYDTLLNPYTQEILGLDILSMSGLKKQQWTPQSAGISILPELVTELEAVWDDFLENANYK